MTELVLNIRTTANTAEITKLQTQLKGMSDQALKSQMNIEGASAKLGKLETSATKSGTALAQMKVEVASRALATLQANGGIAANNLGKVESSASSLTSHLKTLAIAAAGALGAYASISQLKGAIDSTQALGESVRKLSMITGMTAPAASQMAYAFKATGIDADAAATMLGRFSKNMFAIQVAEEDGTNPSKTTAQLLKDMGIAALDASGHLKPTADLLMETADSFKAMNDPALEAATAINLFGKSGIAMLPFLNQGSAGIAALAKEADTLGLTLSTKNVAQIHEYTLAHRRMEEAIAGVKLQIGMALMPKLTELSDWFVAHQPEIRAFTAEAIDKLGAAIEGITASVQNVAPQFQSAFATMADGFNLVKPQLEWVLDNKVAVAAAFTAIGVAALVAFTPVTGPVAAITAALGGLAYALGAGKNALDDWTKANDNAKRSGNDSRDTQISLQSAFENTDALFKRIEGGSLLLLRDGFYQLGHLEFFVLSHAIEEISTQVSVLKGHIVDDVLPAIGTAWSVLKFEVAWVPDFFTSMTPILAQVSSDFWDVVHAVTALIDEIKKIPSPGDLLGSAARGAAHALHIPGFASGGVTPGGLILAGEYGPELLNVPGGSSVYNNYTTRQMLSLGGSQGGAHNSSNVTNQFRFETHITADSQASDAAMRKLAQMVSEEQQTRLTWARSGGSLPPGGAFSG